MVETDDRALHGEVAQVLRDMKALLRTPEQWTQGQYATDQNGAAVPPRSRNARCWCLVGAVNRVARDDIEVRGLALAAIGDEAVKVIADRITDEDDAVFNVMDFNDDERTTHADVMKAIESALAHMEERDA